MSTRKKYSKEFKLETINLVLQQGYTINIVSLKRIDPMTNGWNTTIIEELIRIKCAVVEHLWTLYWMENRCGLKRI